MTRSKSMPVDTSGNLQRVVNLSKKGIRFGDFGPGEYSVVGNRLWDTGGKGREGAGRGPCARPWSCGPQASCLPPLQPALAASRTEWYD
jgi:hypothetical protein